MLGDGAGAGEELRGLVDTGRDGVAAVLEVQLGVPGHGVAAQGRALGGRGGGGKTTGGAGIGGRSWEVKETTYCSQEGTCKEIAIVI